MQNRLFCVPKPIVLCDKAIGKKKGFYNTLVFSGIQIGQNSYYFLHLLKLSEGCFIDVGTLKKTILLNPNNFLKVSIQQRINCAS